MALGAAAACAFAQEELTVPPGYVKLDTVAKVQIYAKAKDSLGPTARSEFVGKIREIYKAYNEIYHLDVQWVQVGTVEAKFQKLERQRVDFVLFDNEADRDDWFLKAGLQGSVAHVDRYRNALGYALTDGVVGKDAYVALWRHFSHVFVWHHFYFGMPSWLDHGLAEYYAWQNKHVVRPGDFTGYQLMASRLKENKEKGTETPLDVLLLKDRAVFGQQQIDESWVLVHFLMTEWKGTFDALWRMLAAQQSTAFDGEAGVVIDSRRLVKYQLERAFGGAAELQAAWTFHRDALLKSATLPAKYKGTVRNVGDATGFMYLDFRSIPPDTRLDPAGYVPTDTTTTGSFAYSGPWPGPVTVTAAIGDSKDRWSKEFVVQEGRTDKKGTPIKWKDAKVPVGASGKVMRITVRWEVDGGGVYQFSSVQEVMKAKPK